MRKRRRRTYIAKNSPDDNAYFVHTDPPAEITNQSKNMTRDNEDESINMFV